MRRLESGARDRAAGLVATAAIGRRGPKSDPKDRSPDSIRATSPLEGRRLLGRQTRRDGVVELAVRATPVTEAAELERVTSGFRSKYGFGDVMATLTRGRPTIFRLEAR